MGFSINDHFPHSQSPSLVRNSCSKVRVYKSFRPIAARISYCSALPFFCKWMTYIQGCPYALANSDEYGRPVMYIYNQCKNINLLVAFKPHASPTVQMQNTCKTKSSYSFGDRRTRRNFSIYVFFAPAPRAMHVMEKWLHSLQSKKRFFISTVKLLSIFSKPQYLFCYSACESWSANDACMFSTWKFLIVMKSIHYSITWDAEETNNLNERNNYTITFLILPSKKWCAYAGC